MVFVKRERGKCAVFAHNFPLSKKELVLVPEKKMSEKTIHFSEINKNCFDSQKVE